MTTQPGYINACDPVKEQATQDFLELLYRASGRDRKNHPMHGLYTSLYQEWLLEQTPQHDA